jgi:type III restriction enzyme
MRTRWVPGVNRLAQYGRWDFVEMSDVFEISREFGELVEGFVQRDVAVESESS